MYGNPSVTVSIIFGRVHWVKVVFEAHEKLTKVSLQRYIQNTIEEKQQFYKYYPGQCSALIGIIIMIKTVLFFFYYILNISFLSLNK